MRESPNRRTSGHDSSTTISQSDDSKQLGQSPNDNNSPSDMRSSFQGRHKPNQTTQGERTLLIEFTPSLYQLKDLELKCKTVVEQIMIEFEGQKLIPVQSSQFIQADHIDKQKSNGFVTRNQTYQRNKQNSRNRLGSNQSSQQRHSASSASSTSSFLINGLTIKTSQNCILYSLLLTFVIQSLMFLPNYPI